MNDRAIAALVLLAVLGAGCTALQNPLGGSEYPAGVNESGLHNATALDEAHAEALSGQAHVAELWFNSSVPNSTVDLSGTEHQLVRVGDGGTPLRVTQNTTSPAQNSEQDVWANDTHQVARQVEGQPFGEDQVYYRRGDGVDADEPASAAGNLLEELLTAGDYTSPTVDDGDDGRRVTMTADSVATGGEIDSGNVTAYDGTVVVDGEGRIRSLAVTYEVNSSGTVVRANVSYELRDVGGPVDVERPDWFDQALAEAPQVEVDVSVVDGRYVEVTNDGSDPIPADAFYMLFFDGSGASDTYSEALDSGDTVYLWLPSEDGTTRVSTDTPDEAVALSGEYEVRISPGEGPPLVTETVTVDGDG